MSPSSNSSINYEPIKGMTKIKMSNKIFHLHVQNQPLNSTYITKLQFT